MTVRRDRDLPWSGVSLLLAVLAQFNDAIGLAAYTSC
jgi:hypothetical protein